MHNIGDVVGVFQVELANVNGQARQHTQVGKIFLSVWRFVAH